MSSNFNQQSPQLIEPPYHKRRQVALYIVITIAVIGLIVSLLSQPIAGLENQQDNILNRLAWFAQIVVSFIVILAAVVQLVGVSIRDLFNTTMAKTSIEAFPFDVIQDYDNLLDYLFPDPKNPLISDRKIKYLPQISEETDIAFRQKRMLLIHGKSKTGKTREACELLKRWWYTNPTILIAKRHVGLYPPFKIPENLPNRNLVIIFDDIDHYLGDINALRKLEETLQFFESICHNRGELHVIATARHEQEFWKKLHYDSSQPPWNRFELVQSNLLTAENAYKVINELSTMAEISIEPDLVKNIANKNDGTFLNLALAFRGWISQNISILTQDHINAFEGDIKNTWRRRYEDLIKLRPDTNPVYAAIDFIQSQDIPLHPVVILGLATLMGLSRRYLFISGLIIHLQNLSIMSPKLNWYRKLTRKYIKATTFNLTVTYTIFYLLLYIPLRFLPTGTILETPLSIYWPVFLFSVFFLFISFFPSLLSRIWKTKLNKTIESLMFLVIEEVPTHQEEIRPYENQFDGNGSTNNWDIKNYSGKIREPGFIGYVSEEIASTYLLLSDYMQQEGDISSANKFASLAQKILPQDPRPLFALGKIKIDEGNFNAALDLLKQSQNLYLRSNSSIYIGGWCALSYFHMGEFDQAETLAKETLREIPDDQLSLWVLALSQLNQKKINEGRKNIQRASSLKGATPSWVKQALEATGISEESWYKKILDKQKTVKKIMPFIKGLMFSLLIIVLGVSFLSPFGFLHNLSPLQVIDATLYAFPNVPFLFVIRGNAYHDLGEYQKSVADYSEAIRIEPNDAYVYSMRGNTYNYYLHEYEKAIEDYTEVIRINPNDADAYGNRGGVYLRTGEYQNAVTDYTQAMLLNPDNGGVYNWNRGLAYSELGEKEMAVSDFTNAFFLRNSADWMFSCGNNSSCWSAAVQFLSNSITINPNDAVSYNYRGIAYNYISDYDKAIADFTEAIRIDPKFHNAYNWRGVIYNKIGRFDKAIPDLTQALLLYPMYSNAFYERANAYYKLGAFEKSIIDYTEAIRINSKYADAYYGRSLAYEAFGKYTEAANDLKVYKELIGTP